MESNAQEFSTRRNIAPMPAPDSADLEQLTRDFRTFVADCETLLKNATALSGSGAAVARAQISERMSIAKSRFDEFRTTAGDRAVRARSATKDYVRREPLMSIGVAAIAGAVLAMMLSRR